MYNIRYEFVRRPSAQYEHRAMTIYRLRQALLSFAGIEYCRDEPTLQIPEPKLYCNTYYTRCVDIDRFWAPSTIRIVEVS